MRENKLKAWGGNLEKDTSNCMVRWGITGIAECMVGGSCPWAIRSLGHGKICSHQNVKKLAVYQPPSWTLNPQIIDRGESWDRAI